MRYGIAAVFQDKSSCKTLPGERRQGHSHQQAAAWCHHGARGCAGHTEPRGEAAAGGAGPPAGTAAALASGRCAAARRARLQGPATTDRSAEGRESEAAGQLQRREGDEEKVLQHG
ncbi:hypothetical protein MRX96_041616 [Rhipicephalus microplus]